MLTEEINIRPAAIARIGYGANAVAGLAANLVHGAFIEYGVLEGILNCLPCGVVVVDRHLNVAVANHAARAMAERSDAISLAGGTFRFMHRRTAGRFQQALARLMPPQTKGDTTFALRVARLYGLSDYYASVTTISVRGNTADGAAEPRYCIWLFDAGSQKRIATRLLTELHGLTSSEAAVAACLYRGLTVDEAANALEVSINTIKTHLKHIFQKCNVRSQAELLQLLALGPTA